MPQSTVSNNISYTEELGFLREIADSRSAAGSTQVSWKHFVQILGELGGYWKLLGMFQNTRLAKTPTGHRWDNIGINQKNGSHGFKYIKYA